MKIYNRSLQIILSALPFLMNCSDGRETAVNRRFFSDDSFWNQPIHGSAEIDPGSPVWISMLASEPTTQNIGINVFQWTIPVYDVDETTPVYTVHPHILSDDEKINWHTERTTFGHGPGFGEHVPIPSEAMPDPEQDAHFAVVDWKRGLAWDMWGFRIRPDGSYESKTGMRYDLYGPGVFRTENLNITNGESVHFHGPSRAAGVPAIAGLIRYDEVMAGEIRHKLAFATRYAAFQEFVYPASWTDGFTPGGIPEGAVIQLDPHLDLNAFDLTAGERVVARALQAYGAVVVDVAQGQPLYAEGLWGHPGKSWEGILRDWDAGICTIPVQHYRFLKTGETTKMGDARSLYEPYW